MQSSTDKATRKTNSTRHARGTFDPVVYFENARGVIAIPPSTAEARRIKDSMSQRGYSLREACTISQVQQLQQRLQKQEIELREGRLEREEAQFKVARDARRARLIARRNSSWCSPYERDVIDAHLRHMDEKHAARVAKERRVEHYFEALEFNDSSHHMLDAVNNVPEMKDEACVKCARYRRVKGLMICAVCMNEVGAANGVNQRA